MGDRMFDKEERQHRKAMRKMRKQRRAKELRIMRQLVDLIREHSDPETHIVDRRAGEWVITLVEQAQGIIMENEALGVWDGKRQPRWYRHMQLQITVQESDDV